MNTNIAIFMLIIFLFGFLLGTPPEQNLLYDRACNAACIRRDSAVYNRTNRECVCRDENNNFVILHSDLGAAFHE